MDKIEIIGKLKEEKIVAVIRAETKEQGIKIVQAVKEGGIKFLEITMTVPGAIDIIKELSEHYAGEDLVIGAGTVLDAETARAAILAGAHYIVSPCFDKPTMILCNRYRVPMIPGAQTITEAVEALEYGADIIKVFPGDAYTPKIIKSFSGPVPQAMYMPTGGVSVENAKEWLNAGAIAVGTGSSLTAGAKTNDFAAITKEAKRFIEAIK